MTIRSLLATAVLAPALSMAAAPGANAQNISDGTKKILAEALKSKGAINQACAVGVDGFTKYVTNLDIKMLQSCTPGLDPF